jgi:D-alanine-D-alanine ligase
MDKNSENKNNKSFLSYLFTIDFLKQLLFLSAVFLGILFLANLWLRFYTKHGQKIELPNFVGLHIDEARNLAEDHAFDIIVNDSVFVVGKKGGIIRDQNPRAKSQVKTSRKIYVTITKYGAESITVGDLPTLYGNPYEQKKVELKYRDIDCSIKDYIYDPGAPNHILEVYYKGELIISKDVRKADVKIEKGSTLECILSRTDGGDVTIPNLKCLDLDEATFLIETSKLDLGSVIRKGDGKPEDIWYVIAQSPQYDGITNIKMGDKISLTLSTSKPMDCN